VLLSIGTRREQVRRVFLLLGILIGATGTLLGLTVGYAFSWIAGTYHLIPLDPQVYAVPFVPFHPSFLDGLWIALAAMGIATLATVIPAREAARLLPVEILRFE
jgi:lipoprotein-releasing system permease protein